MSQFSHTDWDVAERNTTWKMPNKKFMMYKRKVRPNGLQHATKTKNNSIERHMTYLYTYLHTCLLGSIDSETKGMHGHTWFMCDRRGGQKRSCSTVIPNVNLWTVRSDSLRNTSFGIMRCSLYFTSRSGVTEAWMAQTTVAGQAVTMKVVLAPNFHVPSNQFIVQDIKQRRGNVLSGLLKPQGLK